MVVALASLISAALIIDSALDDKQLGMLNSMFHKRRTRCAQEDCAIGDERCWPLFYNLARFHTSSLP